MCIRDSFWIVRFLFGIRLDIALSIVDHDTNFAGTECLTPVSYTHLKRCSLVFQLQRGHDLGQVCLSIRARHSGAVARSLHGAALYPEVQGADAGRFRGAGVHRARHEKR